ncbi:MAG: CHASE3 domain-containing protein, partial [Parafilimonas sp.]
MNSSFKRNLLILYGFSFLILIASSVASYISIHNLLSSQKEIAHTHLILNKLENVISVLKDAETGQRGFLLTGRDEFLDTYNGSLRKDYNLIDEIKNLSEGNTMQLKSADDLKNIIKSRMYVLQTLIENKRKGIDPVVQELLDGKTYMDSARQLVQTMENRETDILKSRTESLNKYASSTPTFIIIASLLSLLVAVISFFKINSDLEKRDSLQKELLQKDEDITNRLNLIQSIAEKISLGDYKIKVSDEGKDVLGSLSGSLNKMAESLDNSFTSLSHNEWLQTGIAGLNDKMIGEKDLNKLTYNVLAFIAEYVEAPVAAFYLAENGFLTLSAGIALDESKVKKQIKFGENLAGQSALSGKEILIEDVGDTDLIISHTAGAIKPKAIISVPVLFEGILIGVIELGSLTNFNAITKIFLKTSTYNIGMAIRSARDDQRLQELLAETQAQSEELQAQHNEMENINAELEVQAEKLQAS